MYEYYIERLEKCNRTEEAIAVAREATALFPDEWIFRLREALILPVLYDSQEQIDQYRRRFTQGLQRIVEEISLDTATDRQRALMAISKNVNKYLGYQGCNDRKLQEQYGGLGSPDHGCKFPAVCAISSDASCGPRRPVADWLCVRALPGQQRHQVISGLAA